MAICLRCEKLLNNEEFVFYVESHDCNSHYLCALDHIAIKGFNRKVWMCLCERILEYDELVSVRERDDEEFQMAIIIANLECEDALAEYNRNKTPENLRAAECARQKLRETIFIVKTIDSLYDEVVEQYAPM